MAAAQQGGGRPQQILILNPANEIKFEGPFEEVVTSYLELRNPSEKRVCFKVKTTAPRRYCVRPNSGTVEPDSKVKIAIMLQPMDKEGLAERHKHKFMVQSVVVGDENSNLDTLWQNITHDSVMDSKLKCVFSSSDGHLTSSPTHNKTSNLYKTMNDNERNDAISDSMMNNTQSSQRLSQTSERTGKITDSTQRDDLNSSSTSGRRIEATRDLMQANKKSPGFSLDKSATSSSHNNTVSFLQQVNDHPQMVKIVILQLICLVIGIILGKFVI